ncbi:hypothetical protein [Micromonospora carbonacea]|uniref:hypothetical protein n=1 Tax=Micromonospora carbonacea TaxID=47853 RepID=UPI00114C9ED1|nr:hypothetical protein [Micromonospora carbonacea]
MSEQHTEDNPLATGEEAEHDGSHEARGYPGDNPDRAPNRTGELHDPGRAGRQQSRHECSPERQLSPR